MFEPDFRLSDDEDAHLDLYEAYWTHWRGVFRQAADSAEAFYQHLYTFELRQPETDVDQLIDIFLDAHAELSRRLYNPDDDQHHFGLAFPVEEDAQIAVRALVLVHPNMVAEMDVFSAAGHSHRGFSMARFEPERGDAGVPWRWLTDQLQISAISTAARQPSCFVLASG